MYPVIRTAILVVSVLSLLTMPAFLALGLAMAASGHAALGIPVALLSVLFGWGYFRALRVMRDMPPRVSRPLDAWHARPAW